MTANLTANYLPVNSAWVITFGDSIIRLEDKSGPLGRFFPTLEELDYCLNLCGLKRSSRNIITRASEG